MAFSANTQINALIDAARDMFITRPMIYWAGIRGKLSNLPGTNFDMGCAFAQRGAMRDAAMRFRIAVKLDPNFAQAWHNLGVCLMQLNDKQKAMEAFQRTLALRPNDEEASYLLATISPSALPRDAWPTRMPRAMIERFFAAAAPYYVQVETQNKYAGPQVCEQKILPHLTTKTGLTVMDLGCGVGLASAVWRDKAAHITGVDIVPEMVNEARNTRSGNLMVFDAVIEGDLHAPDGIAIPEASADVALLCNTSQFLGDLTGTMRGITKWLKPGGVVAITVEPATGQAAFGVNPATGRFGHSAAYLQDMAKTYGFSVLVQERVNLYPDVAAGIVVLRKN
jgi:predicted TPR repeat methyltransferase